MGILERLRLLILPIRAMDKLLPAEGTIYDVGCGYGSLTRGLAEHRPRRTVVGIDLDAKKVRRAQRGRNPPNLRYEHANALEFPFKPCAGVVISDFLHHVDFESQDQLIKLVASKLIPKGVLLIKEVARDDAILLPMSRFWDFVFYPGHDVFYRSRGEWLKIMASVGFPGESKRKVRWFPCSTNLFFGSRKVRESRPLERARL